MKYLTIWSIFWGGVLATMGIMKTPKGPTNDAWTVVVIIGFLLIVGSLITLITQYKT